MSWKQFPTVWEMTKLLNNRQQSVKLNLQLAQILFYESYLKISVLFQDNAISMYLKQGRTLKRL